MTELKEIIESLEKCGTIQSADYCLNKCPYRSYVSCKVRQKNDAIEALREYRKRTED